MRWHFSPPHLQMLRQRSGRAGAAGAGSFFPTLNANEQTAVQSIHGSIQRGPLRLWNDRRRGWLGSDLQRQQLRHVSRSAGHRRHEPRAEQSAERSAQPASGASPRPLRRRNPPPTGRICLTRSAATCATRPVSQPQHPFLPACRTSPSILTRTSPCTTWAGLADGIVQGGAG
jgi:hypothetical protein